MLPIDPKAVHRLIHPSEKPKAGEAKDVDAPKPTVWLLSALTARQDATLSDMGATMSAAGVEALASGDDENAGTFSLMPGSIALRRLKLALVGVENFGGAVLNRKPGPDGDEADDAFLDTVPAHVRTWLASEARNLSSVSVDQAKPS